MRPALRTVLVVVALGLAAWIQVGYLRVLDARNEELRARQRTTEILIGAPCRRVIRIMDEVYIMPPPRP